MTTQIETHIQYNHSYMVTDEYMAQEEDWDRDLLLDPAWEKQQRKVGRENSRSKMGSRPNLGLSERNVPQESCWVTTQLARSS